MPRHHSRMTVRPGAAGATALAASVLLGACATASVAADGEPARDLYGKKVNVNQEGYLPSAPKTAVVVAEDAEQFRVLELGTETEYYRGELTEAVDDESSGDTVQQADFSDLDDSGLYVLEVEGVGHSYPFRIHENVYRSAFIDALRHYTLQRANFHVDDPVTGVFHGEAHMQDAQAEMYFSDEFHDEGETLDMLGGWYDAGDFGKYTTPGAITVAQILLAYEWSPQTFTQGQMLFPAQVEDHIGATDMPDVLVEMKWKLDWLQKVQRPDGAVYHKVSGARWPGMETRPEQDDQTRYVFGMSTYGTGMFAGTLAMAARQYEPYDPDYAAELLEAAKLAFEYLEANPEPYFREDEDQDSGSGPYDKHTDEEERFWAAAELFKTTGDSHYETYLEETLPEYFSEEPGYISWYNGLALGHWAYVTAEEASPERQAEVEAALLGSADAILEQVERDGYNTALTPDQYTWASAKNAVASGNMLLKAYRLTEDEAYEDAALEQIHYILGRNATSYSYLSGSGVQQVQNVHHRIWNATNTPVPGLLVGGPNNHPGGDPLQEAMIADGDIPPAKAYVDDLQSWSTNEYAIDYTAPVVFTLAHFKGYEDDTEVDPAEAEALDEAGPPEDPERDYTRNFAEAEPFSDAASTIEQELQDDGSLEVTYDLVGSGWLGISSEIMEDWADYSGIALTLAGGSGNTIQIEFRDRHNTLYSHYVEDDSDTGKRVEITFNRLAQRRDWQPDEADTSAPRNFSPLRGINIAPTEGSGTLVVRDIHLME